MRLAIRSDAVISKDGRILLEGKRLIGDWVKEGEDIEKVCVNKAKKVGMEIELARPLHPMIQWVKDNNEEKAVIVSLSYLAQLKEEEHGR